MSFHNSVYMLNFLVNFVAEIGPVILLSRVHCCISFQIYYIIFYSKFGFFR